MANLIKKLFGLGPEAQLKPLMKIADKIEALEPEMQKLTDEQLRPKQTNSVPVTKTAKRWTRCCPKPLPWYGKPPGVPLACVLSGYS